MSVIIDISKSELEAVIKYARYGANNCMIGNGWEIKELVRCKDCKHWTEVYQDRNGYEHGYCEVLAVDNGSFFCAYGERKEEPEADTKTDHWGYERLFCPNCKAQYTKGQRYCDNCGHKLI